MPPPADRASRASIAGLGAVLLLTSFYILHAGQGTSPFYDEWEWITRRRGLSAHTLLDPHNGHLSLVPVLIYKALLQTAGLADYWVGRAVLAGLHVACAVLVFLLARRRVGIVGGAFAAAFVAVLGSAADDLIWAFQIGFLIGVAFGLGALLALDSDSRRGDAVAAVLLTLSLASASVGAAFAIAAAVEIVLHPRRRERWWAIAVPIALYGLWYVGFGEGQMRRDNLGETPTYAAESGATAVGGIVGLSVEYGRVLLVGLTALVVRRLWADGETAPRLAALAVAPAALWILTGLSRAQFKEPSAPRYIYCGAVLVILLVCELHRDRRVADTRAGLLLGALLALAAVGNANALDATSGMLRYQARDIRARLGALQLIGAGRVDPRLRFSPVNAPQLEAGLTLYAERSFGTIGLSPAELARVGDAQGAAADDVLRSGGNLITGPAVPTAAAARPPAPGATAVRGGTSSVRGACLLTRSASQDTRLDLVLRGDESIIVSADAETGVLSRRFARSFPGQPTAEIPPGGSLRVAAQPDASAVPWRLQFASAGNLRVCRARLPASP